MEDWQAVRRGRWFALEDGKQAPVGDGLGLLRVVDLGEVNLVSGAVGACDPFVRLDACPTWVTVKPGRYPVKLTIADVSPDHDGSDLVEAFVTLLVDPQAEEVHREMLEAESWGGIGVDAGIVCFVDADAARRATESFDRWDDLVEGPGGWFERLDDPEHFGPGRANVPLPGLDDGSNVVMCHSGWGDGIYPVVAGYDAAGQVVAVHIDLQVTGGSTARPVEPAMGRTGPTARTKAYANAIMLIPAFIFIALGLWRQWPAEVVAIGTLLCMVPGWAFSLWKGWVKW
jgi:hypothetical protein